MITKEMWDELEIGTIFLSVGNYTSFVYIKINANEYMIINDSNVACSDLTGDVNRINDCELIHLMVAPKSIVELWEVLE